MKRLLQTRVRYRTLVFVILLLTILLAAFLHPVPLDYPLGFG